MRSAQGRNATAAVEKRDTFVSKEMTWYPTDTGADACTGKNHLDSDFFVAMGYDQFGDGSGCCGRKLRINYNGKSAVAPALTSAQPARTTARSTSQRASSSSSIRPRRGRALRLVVVCR
ncbi:hypothetical protein B0H17DRAFT_111683 [Mycena rosella]|uniref:Uncharacterized protein n=1 Tax=Mycena rosella TaxID=1033263 RepID=A0AAD7D3U9_MYCRO|nr:hypothetical protein B0H17DRAFT_111683 [Mycena rosella]